MPIELVAKLLDNLNHQRFGILYRGILFWFITVFLITGNLVEMWAMHWDFTSMDVWIKAILVATFAAFLYIDTGDRIRKRKELADSATAIKQAVDEARDSALKNSAENTDDNGLVIPIRT